MEETEKLTSTKHATFLSLKKLWFFTGTSHVLPNYLCSHSQRRFRASIETTVKVICAPVSPKFVIFYQNLSPRRIILLFSSAVEAWSKKLGTDPCFGSFYRNFWFDLGQFWILSLDLDRGKEKIIASWTTTLVAISVLIDSARCVSLAVA